MDDNTLLRRLHDAIARIGCTELADRIGVDRMTVLRVAARHSVYVPDLQKITSYLAQN